MSAVWNTIGRKISNFYRHQVPRRKVNPNNAVFPLAHLVTAIEPSPAGLLFHHPFNRVEVHWAALEWGHLMTAVKPNKHLSPLKNNTECMSVQET